MRYHEIALDEDAKQDLSNLVAARNVVRSFLAFIKSHEGKKLIDIPHCRLLGTHRTPYYVFDIKDILPNLGIDNLFIGVFSSSDPQHRGSEAHFTLAGHRSDIGVVAMNNGTDDPRDDDDCIHLFQQSFLVHEVIHYFDWLRFKRPRAWTKSVKAMNANHRKRAGSMSDEENANARRREYYNSPKEMNAYFQQGVNDLMQSLRRAVAEKKRYDQEDPEWGEHWRPEALRSFSDFYMAYGINHFDWGWRDALDEENKKVFKKRLYRLYFELQQAWPNIDAVDQDVDNALSTMRSTGKWIHD